ncbi:MAG: VWA domain-containing protein [bacterium]|nr:VWA domain-containing protein [bacterium]
MEDQNGQKSSLTGIAAGLSRLPAEKRRAALEVSAALAGVSLKASREFVAAVPVAAEILSAEDIRLWGELGRRLAMGSADAGAKFFADGVEPLSEVPEAARPLVFQICTRQLVLSSSIALETYYSIPKLAKDIGDDELLTDVLKLALDIANRSAKHSAEFIQKTPPVAEALGKFGESKREVASAAIKLASVFATRTGGMTADLWGNLPKALEGLDAESARKLADAGVVFLDHGGSVTLHFISSGAEVFRTAASVFDEWCEVLQKIGKHGNAVLIAFLRATPKFFSQIATFKHKQSSPLDKIRRVLELTGTIAETDAESALAAFRSSTAALRKVTLEQFEEWIETGLRKMADESTKARRSYFALETRQSHEHLSETRTGLALEKIQTVLRIYIEGLTGKEVEIAPLTAIPQESRIGDGKTIYLPATIAEFDDEERDFRLFKVLAAHGAGQIEFGTFEKDGKGLKAAFAELSSLYEASEDDRDMFSLGGYIADVQKAEKAEVADKNVRVPKLPKESDYREVLKVFPEPRLARKIFGTMENARVDNRLRQMYKGLRKDLDLMRRYLAEKRPYIFDVPIHQVPFELLFQITMCGGATDDARQFYGQIVSEIETVIESYLAMEKATVADSLMATSRVYSLFMNITPEQMQESAEPEQQDEKNEYVFEDKNAAEGVTEDKIQREPKPKQPDDVKDLFNAWNSLEEDAEPDDLQGSEAWTQNEMPEQALEPGDEAFAYDEWDRELNDYRVGWSRVIEKKVKQGDRTFVELARTRYRGVISSIRHQFQLMKPENLTRVNREIDGEDYDLNALVEYVVDKKADGNPSENIYTKRLRKQRDVAVSLLLDQSSSTARTITRNPLQPYTYPGRRIIEIEKEGLVLMSEALEAVGDVYAINGFTSEGRRNVKFYVVKDFHEKYSDETERRIGGITFQNNTRLGAAIRHAAHKLLKQESRTKLLIILTDGRPYDHDYGDARYAREDVREALIEAKTHNITPFCITVDRESESELKDLYGDVGYTIIDDVLSLPERMPSIYRRLTS